MGQCVWHHVLSRLTGFEVRMIIIMCSAISEADACEVANTHGRDGLDKVIEALRAFKVAVTKDIPGRGDWENGLALTRWRTVELLQRVYFWYAARPTTLTVVRNV